MGLGPVAFGVRAHNTPSNLLEAAHVNQFRNGVTDVDGRGYVVGPG